MTKAIQDRNREQITVLEWISKDDLVSQLSIIFKRATIRKGWFSALVLDLIGRALENYSYGH